MLTAKKFGKRMKKRNTTVIDVRTAEEYTSHYFPIAQNIDVQQENFTSQIIIG
ncbi:MAG: hypothetical protein ICV81_01185 [Flavisolibacter sp.]|nr:hypothetical protein [Flavisolibacter sp.]